MSEVAFGYTREDVDQFNQMWLEMCGVVPLRYDEDFQNEDLIFAFKRFLRQKQAARNPVIAGKTIDGWREFAKEDRCLDNMVPSDLRQLVGALSALPLLRQDSMRIKELEALAKKLVDASRHLKGDTEEIQLRDLAIAEAEKLGIK